MNVEVKRITPWNLALNMARQTVGKPSVEIEPSGEWKAKIIKAEHSPIRCVEYLITITDAPYFVIMHLVRHHIGIEKFVSTSRPDRTGGKDRHELPQDALINASFVCNVQALINISRVRLCACASKETRQLWTMVRNRIKALDPEVAEAMVPNCIYRGFCPELKSCNALNTHYYKAWREKYIKKT